MIIWAVADRALDIIGLCTVIYWTVRATLYFARRARSRQNRADT